MPMKTLLLTLVVAVVITLVEAMVFIAVRYSFISSSGGYPGPV